MQKISKNPNPEAKINFQDIENSSNSGIPKLEIIFDSSGSMGQKIDRFQTRMYAAKKVVAKFLVDQWKKKSLVGLRVYGSRRRNDCKDSFLSIPFGENSLDSIERSISMMLPIGRTPLFKSVNEAIADLKEYKGPKGIVVFTDGKETCGGDLCKFAKKLQSTKDIDIKIFTVGVGFNLKEKKYEGIHCLQKLGPSFSANSENDLLESLGKISDDIQISNNLKVIAPDPGLQVDLFHWVNGQRKFYRSFTAAWGIQVPPGDYEAVVATTPHYTFPKFEIPPNKKVTLRMAGHGKVHINFAKNLLNIEFLDSNGKIIAKTKSGITKKVPMGIYIVRTYRPPYFEELIEDFQVYPDGKYKINIPNARSVTFSHPSVEGFYIYNSKKEMLGNYLTNHPLVLPREQYRFYLSEKCNIKRVRLGELKKTGIARCSDAKKNIPKE